MIRALSTASPLRSFDGEKCAWTFLRALPPFRSQVDAGNPDTLTRRARAPSMALVKFGGSEKRLATRFELLRSVVHPWHLDHFGHMNVRHYAPFFDDAAYHLWTQVGLPYSRMLTEHGVHTVTAQATTRFMKELVAGDLIVVDGVATRLGNKSVSFELQMRHADTGELHAVYETTEVFFDPAKRTSTPMPESVRKALQKCLDTQP